MALQELCIASIASSIDRYYHAYASSYDLDLHKKFQLLQKVYSFQLVSWLNDEDLLQEEYADMVFTKYLKSVDTDWFSKFSWKTIVDTLKKIGPSLEKVYFTEDTKDVQWKNIICCLPNVKTITYESFCNDDILECIARYCAKLETLDIKRSYDVTDVGLKYFYQTENGNVPCPLLKEIFIESTSVNDEGIKCLVKNLPLLSIIDYSELPMVLYEMHNNDLNSLHQIEYKLIRLDLLHYWHMAHTPLYDDILRVCVTVCPNLKSLHCPVYKLDHLNLYMKLPNVEDLNLSCIKGTFIDVNDVLKEKGGRLTSLTLCNSTVSLLVLGQYCPRLNQLTMDQVSVKYDENDSVPKFYHLKEFTVENVDSSESSCYKAISCILASSPILENLHLKKCNTFTSEMKTNILKCCEQCALKIIGFSGSSVETEFLKDILLTCSTLEVLKIDGCDVSLALEEDLYRIAETVPNRPEIVCTDESYFSDYDELLNDYEDYLDDTDDDDDDDHYLGYDGDDHYLGYDDDDYDEEDYAIYI